jgi:predicted unusual protein kinase regulating ubiquinone biosynthesis (AarF/ABC1/UbiB family)
MSTNVTDALQALPADLREPAPSVPGRPLSDLAQGAPPTSAWYRSWLLGSTGARIALGYAALGLRNVVADPAQRESRRDALDREAAVRLLARMGYLRGAAMKVGQILAQMPELTSDEVADTLGALCFEAPPMHAALIREQVRSALGQDPDEAFASFEPEAFAAASLGQVHRAETHDGRAVAVKVQYPGIGRAVRADLATLRLMVLGIRFSPHYRNIRDQVAVMTEMFTSETDYRREARMQARARELLHEEDGIVVPAVVDDLSSERVLTTELLTGHHLTAYLATDPSETQRRRAAERIWRGLLRLFYHGRLTYNDPNPGNIVFLDDGRIGIIDFGCSEIYGDEDWAIIRDIDVAAYTKADDLDERIAVHMGYDAARPRDREAIELSLRILDWFQEPMQARESFNFAADDYMDRGIEHFKDAFRRRQLRQSPFAIWSNRLLIGIRAILRGGMDAAGHPRCLQGEARIWIALPTSDRPVTAGRMPAPPRACCRPRQAAGRGAERAARPDVTDLRRSAADRAGERRQDAADRSTRGHRFQNRTVIPENATTSSSSPSSPIVTPASSTMSGLSSIVPPSPRKARKSVSGSVLVVPTPST